MVLTVAPAETGRGPIARWPTPFILREWAKRSQVSWVAGGGVENSDPFELGCATEVFGLRRTGLGPATNLRALLRRETGLSPTEHRRRFAPR
jgi:hypothetical protein